MELIFTRNREKFMHLYVIESLINMKRFNDDHEITTSMNYEASFGLICHEYIIFYSPFSLLNDFALTRNTKVPSGAFSVIFA